MSIGLPAALALAVLNAAPVERIAVVDVDAPPTMMGLASQVTQDVVRAAQAQKKKVMTPDEVRNALGNKSYGELVKCAERVACAGSLAGPLGVDRIVTGTLNRDEKNYLFKLWLIDLKASTVVADVDRAVLIASRRFGRDVEESVPGLLRGQKEAKGTLVLTATAKNCSVTLNGEPVGHTPLKLELKPGRYEVKVEKKAYLSVARLVDVEANQLHSEELRMLVIPGQTPEDEKVPDLARAPAGPEAAPSGFHPRWPSFVGVGLTVAAVGVGLGFGLSAQGTERRLLDGHDAATDTWAGTRQQALDAQRDATAANVAWVVAGALGALTVVSLVLDATAQPAPATVGVLVTPGGAGLVVGGRF